MPLFKGKGSYGYAKGTAFIVNKTFTEKADNGCCDPEIEKKRFRDSAAAVHEDLQNLCTESENGDIFAAHLEMLDDPMLLEQVESCIDSGQTARQAVISATDSIAMMLSEIDDEYLSSRADDVRDLGIRLCSRLDGQACGDGSASPFTDIPYGSILVADELLPSDTAMIDFNRLAGIVTAKGSVTSHVCIIARSKGVPVIVGADGIVSGVSAGDEIMLSVAEGEIFVNPTDEEAAVYAAREASYLAGLISESEEETKGTFPVYANAGSVDDVVNAISAGADGIGLFRTEFLFMEKDSLPDEEEQFQSYRAAAEACGGRPIVIRTLDIGGDKGLPYLNLPAEENPFLGLRSMRICLKEPELLKTQLRAILRAASYGDVRVMFPMISKLEELRKAREMLEEARKELDCRTIPAGMMIETPAAALLAEEFAAECDFFSIGTNDLTQYVLAADRGNASVAYIYDSKDPAVMKAIRMTAEAATSAGIPVGMCGELASDPGATVELLEIGLTSLSVSAPCIQMIRKQTR